MTLLALLKSSVVPPISNICMTVLNVRTVNTLYHKIRKKYYQKFNCAALFPIPTFIYLWAFYIFLRSVRIICCSKIGGPIVGNRSQFHFLCLGIHKSDLICSALKRFLNPPAPFRAIASVYNSFVFFVSNASAYSNCGTWLLESLWQELCTTLKLQLRGWLDRLLPQRRNISV